MFNRYYQQELSRLKELGAEYSKAHPAIAPMLSGTVADPDVERVLEGVAFLSALLRQKLDDDFPEVVHDLMDLIWPHYLRPVPSTCVVSFSPKPTLKQPARVPAGVQIASTPVEGIPCLFRTCYDVEVHPLVLAEASFSRPAGHPPSVSLVLELRGRKLPDWQPGSLRLFLAGEYAQAADLYLLLRRHLTRVLLRSLEGGSVAELPPDALRPVGFSAGEALIPYPSHAYPGYRVLQEYFVAPEKFLFLDLSGWDRWLERGSGSRFEVRFELDNDSFTVPKVTRESFALFASPCLNLFPCEADPILLDHRAPEYQVRPSGGNPDHYEIYSVDEVVGLVQGTGRPRRYLPFERFSTDPSTAPTFHLSRRGSPVRAGFDVYLSVVYPPEAGPPVPETLSMQLTCTNGVLPAALRIGDVSRPTSSSPEFLEFRNLNPPTPPLPPPLGENLLWRLVSHLSLNYLSLSRGENLKALLELYLFGDGRGRAASEANRRRIGGIEGVEARPLDRLVAGVPMRGQEIEVAVRQDHFPCPGDLYLFGCVLNHFLGGYSSINTYTRLTIRETTKGGIYRWPARVGTHPLI